MEYAGGRLADRRQAAAKIMYLHLTAETPLCRAGSREVREKLKCYSTICSVRGAPSDTSDGPATASECEPAGMCGAE